MKQTLYHHGKKLFDMEFDELKFGYEMDLSHLGTYIVESIEGNGKVNVLGKDEWFRKNYMIGDKTVLEIEEILKEHGYQIVKIE